MTTVTVPGFTISTMDSGTLVSGVVTGGTITRTSGHMAVIVTIAAPPPGAWVELPSSMCVGDTVEIYIDPTTNYELGVMPPSGETFLGGEAFLNSAGTSIGGLFRKLSDTVWGIVL